jgi:hypothetical protein
MNQKAEGKQAGKQQEATMDTPTSQASTATLANIQLEFGPSMVTELPSNKNRQEAKTFTAELKIIQLEFGPSMLPHRLSGGPWLVTSQPQWQH